jgi:hypothetical protein
MDEFPANDALCLWCSSRAIGSHGGCYHHDEDFAEERSSNASNAAKAKANGRLRKLDKQLADLATGVLSNEVDRGAAAVVTQILNARLRLVEIERKIREQEEILERLLVLEEANKLERSPYGY